MKRSAGKVSIAQLVIVAGLPAVLLLRAGAAAPVEVDWANVTVQGSRAVIAPTRIGSVFMAGIWVWTRFSRMRAKTSRSLKRNAAAR